METNTQKNVKQSADWQSQPHHCSCLVFTGRADVYAKARPSYPDSALEYIVSLAPSKAVFADIGAGTGKFTECLAKQGRKLFAVEPNDDMRKQLVTTLSSFPNATIINGTAEVTTLPSNSVDVITVAQALHWFDPEIFRAECRRIAKQEPQVGASLRAGGLTTSKAGVLVVAIYNHTPEKSQRRAEVSAVSPSSSPLDKIGGSKGGHRKEVLDAFFTNPTYTEFPNPVTYTRESWLQFMSSHSRNPLPTEP
ncbi:MAG: class I SAM-dependent methyltransferase, partial [Oscillospiraceae bacterium]|nr:class I SAM-dependent methyltransferase [Oscillospiraceae bacterium]